MRVCEGLWEGDGGGREGREKRHDLKGLLQRVDFDQIWSNLPLILCHCDTVIVSGG